LAIQAAANRLISVTRQQGGRVDPLDPGVLPEPARTG
jgi:hypothetical protein